MYKHTNHGHFTSAVDVVLDSSADEMCRDINSARKGRGGRTEQIGPTRTDDEVEAAGTLADLINDDWEQHGEAVDRRSRQSMEQQQQMQQNTRLETHRSKLGLAPTTGAATSALPAALLEQYPALRNINWYIEPSDGHTDEDLPHVQPQQLPCPVKALWDRWVADTTSPGGFPLPRQQCQSCTGSDLPGLRIHLEADHGMHAVCVECNESLRDRAKYRWYHERSHPWQHKNPWAPCGLKGGSPETIIAHQFMQLEMPSTDFHDPTPNEWFLVSDLSLAPKTTPQASRLQKCKTCARTEAC